MTILNIFVRPDRALIGMDTTVVNSQGGQSFEASKFGVLPESGLFMGWRGDTAAGAILFAECLAAQCYIDFDVIEPEMPRLIVETLKTRHQQRIAQGAPPDALSSPHCHSFQVGLVGWSKSAERMRGTLFTKQGEAGVVGVEPISATGIIAPGDIIAPSLREPVSSVAAMERVARAQFNAAKAKGDSFRSGFGGALLLIEIERDQVRIRRRRIFEKPVGC